MENLLTFESLIMDFRTTLKKIDFPFELSHDDQIITFGSCFADLLGHTLDKHKFDIQNNPFGILFNPSAIYNGLKDILNQKVYTEHDLTYFNNEFLSLNHHSKFNHANLESCLEGINNEIAKAFFQLQKAKVLFITFGSAYAYRYLESNKLVANCHKIPNPSFAKEIISVEHIVLAFEEIIAKLQEFNPDLQIVFTVSPIRHIKDGIIENNRSKAHLISAVHDICEVNDQCHYFPAYELLMDDLRDYRFYSRDMVHPSSTAEQYILEYFENCFYSNITKDIIKQIKQIQKLIEHRTETPYQNSYLMGVKKQLTNAIMLSSQFDKLDLSKEIAHFENILTQEGGN